MLATRVCVIGRVCGWSVKALTNIGSIAFVAGSISAKSSVLVLHESDRAVLKPDCCSRESIRVGSLVDV